VYSNDSANSQTMLTIKADVGNPNHGLQMAPEQAVFGQVLIGNDNIATIKLSNKSGNRLKIKIVDMPSLKFIQDVKIRTNDQDPTSSAYIEITMNDFIMLGDFKTSLTIEAESDPSSRTTIPISGTVIEQQGSLNK